MDIGVIGLGNMGALIAANLIAAGFEVTVFNRNPEKAEPLIAQGATLAHDAAGAAQGDIVITMLADDHALESVVFGEKSKSKDDEQEGMLIHQGERTIHISMSTISVQLARRVAEASAAGNRNFISAPVMGRPDVAERGELIIMPAGKHKLIEKCMSVFQAIGKSVHTVGDAPEQANVFKLSANFMISSMIETFAEAFALLRKNDVDHHLFHEIMAKEFFKSPVYEKYGKIIADGKFETGAFTIRGQEKDTRLALSAAIDAQVPMPICSAIETAFLSAIGRGKGELDPCALAELAAENAGLSGRKRK
jgi:3-hydroxyisobutyrate dehydrogenase-like beta-hydroxyacid dehydrogenase